jgi:hypothetical protein
MLNPNIIANKMSHKFYNFYNNSRCIVSYDFNKELDKKFITPFLLKIGTPKKMILKSFSGAPQNCLSSSKGDT